MNKMRFKALAAAVAAGGLFFAPGSVVQASAQQQVQLFHRLPDAKAGALKDLVERFNAQSKDVQVVMSAADWRSGAPHLMILEGDDEEEFVAGKPWVHIDIAGTAQSGAAKKWINHGPTGFGARLLIDVALNFRAE